MKFAVLLSQLVTTAYGYTFLSIGDWGANAIPDRGSMSYTKNVGAVANQLTSVSESSAFVLNLGDSFYWCGIQNTSDFQVNTDFIEPYKDIKLDWYGVLGNHEYGYNVSAVRTHSFVTFFFLYSLLTYVPHSTTHTYTLLTYISHSRLSHTHTRTGRRSCEYVAELDHG